MGGFGFHHTIARRTKPSCKSTFPVICFFSMTRRARFRAHWWWSIVWTRSSIPGEIPGGSKPYELLPTRRRQCGFRYRRVIAILGPRAHLTGMALEALPSKPVPRLMPGATQSDQRPWAPWTPWPKDPMVFLDVQGPERTEACPACDSPDRSELLQRLTSITSQHRSWHRILGSARLSLHLPDALRQQSRTSARSAYVLSSRRQWA